MPRRTQEQYETDSGFTEDAPKGKKVKASTIKEVKKSNVSTEKQQDDDGNDYWELSRVRRVGISEFKNMKMINIREYYEKDGKSLPGKKGISLSMEQYSTLLAVLPQIEESLKSKGVEVPRPDYDAVSTSEGTKGEANDDENEDDDQAEDPKPAASHNLDKFRMKPNHEATSDEDED